MRNHIRAKLGNPCSGAAASRAVWEKPQIGTATSKHSAGLLDTAGGLLFYGDPNGDFVAINELSVAG